MLLSTNSAENDMLKSLSTHVISYLSSTERIRMGAPDEQDWWKEGDATEDDSTWLMSSSGVSESMDESIAIEGDGNSRSMAKSPSSVSTSTDGSPKKFHNCGLETWEKARAVWTAKPDNGSNSSITRNAQPVNQRELGKLLSKASSLRTYELPRRIPLTSLVESYVSVWNSDD